MKCHSAVSGSAETPHPRDGRVFFPLYILPLNPKVRGGGEASGLGEESLMPSMTLVPPGRPRWGGGKATATYPPLPTPSNDQTFSFSPPWLPLSSPIYRCVSFHLLYLFFVPLSLQVESKVTLGIGGVIIVLLSVVASVGVFGFVGVPATLIIFEIIPFLVLAVGVDNIFILVQTYQRDPRRGPTETHPEHVGRIVGEVRHALFRNLFASNNT